MPDFDFETIIDLSEQVKGKTIKTVSFTDGPHGADLLMFDFTDGTSLQMSCDVYEIYEWEVLG